MTTTDRRFRIGFRGRVLGSFVLLVAAATFGGLIVQRAVLLRALDADVDSTLDQERAELASLARGTDPDTGEPFGGDAQAIIDTFLQRNVPHDGEAFFSILDGEAYSSTPAPVRLDQDVERVERWAQLTSGERGRLSTDAGPVRYLAMPLRYQGETSGVVIVANFVEGERADVERNIRVAAFVALGILLIATAVAWWVAGRLLRPVRQLTEAAEGISDMDLSRRIPVEGDDEIARLGRRFNEMLDRLSGAFASQRAFIGAAGHELRTPITIVRGHIELLGDDPEERAETLALVTDELDRMTRIVGDLLLLAKAEQPDFVQRSPVEVADLTADLFEKARALGDRAWSLDATGTGVVDVDAHRLTQAVLNLARNAVEHTPDGAQVAVGSSLGGDHLLLWVRDTGDGVPADEHEQIFEQFHRGRRTRRHSEGGGLGLPIVRSIAEAHGGRAWVDSTPGTGATFLIEVPVTVSTEPYDEPTVVEAAR